MLDSLDTWPPLQRRPGQEFWLSLLHTVLTPQNMFKGPACLLVIKDILAQYPLENWVPNRPLKITIIIMGGLCFPTVEPARPFICQ